MGAKSYHFDNNKVTKFQEFSNEDPFNYKDSPEHADKKKILSGICILIVDDSSINQIVAQKTLQKCGAKIRMASNGKLGLSAYINENFDLVLMDLEMPELDGFEATAMIKNTKKYQANKIPILAYTTHSYKEIKERMEEVGMDGYIGKPFTHDKVMSDIVHCVKSRVGA